MPTIAQRHQWEVTVERPSGSVSTFRTRRRRSVLRMLTRRREEARKPAGRNAGATVRLLCDGQELSTDSNQTDHAKLQ